MSDRMPDHWQRRSLSSLGEYENGFAFNELHWSEQGLPIVRIAQITGTQGIVDRYPGRLPDTFCIESGDVIFSWSGTLAVVRWAGGPAWLNQHLFKVVPAAGIDKSLLFHLLQASVAEMNKRTHGSTMKHIKRGELREFFITLPVGGDEQRKLAQVLDTLDTAINESEAIIAKLKAVKQGLLHDLLTRGIDANGELRPPQPEAPHLYTPSPLGWIPMNWQVAPLSSHIASLDAGVSVNSEDRPHGSGEVGVLKTSALSQGRFLSTQNKAVVARERTLVREAVLGDSILVSRMNTPELVGESCYVPRPWPTLFLPDRIWQLKKSSTDSVDMRWLSYVLLTARYRAYVQVNATGTSGSMKNLPKSRLFAMLVAFPCADEQTEIAARMAAADERVASEESFLEKLRAQKSGLMDDLLTGRVRVTPLLSGVAPEEDRT
jgi:type I restriction enzyme S subunit